MALDIFFDYEPRFTDDQKDHLSGLVQGWHEEVLEHIPNLKARDVVFSDPKYAYWNTGGGSWSYKIGLELKPEYLKEDPEVPELKGTFFHESFHGVQGWFHDEYEDIPAIDNGITEGVAVVFEETRSGHKGDHFDTSNLDIPALISELDELGEEAALDEWKFYHNEKKEPILLYKIGATIVYTALENNPTMKVEQLAKMDPSKIREMSGM